MGKYIYVYLIIFTEKSKTTCPINCVIESNANSPSVLVGSVLICICQRAQLLEVLYRYNVPLIHFQALLVNCDYA